MTRTTLLAVLGLLLGLVVFGRLAIGSERLKEVRERVEPVLKKNLETAGLKYGAPVFVRVLKEESELEIWVQETTGKPWKLFRKWPVANYSGSLGPKLKEGDYQAPEGFYQVGLKQLNPNSNFHLSFDIGYPNPYDRHHKRTGSYIMVHGGRASIGCFAMTDPVIEEIYLLVEAALKAGRQKRVPVHIFPFRMTAEKLAEATAEYPQWSEFWTKDLLPGYEQFEKTGIPPKVNLGSGHYQVSQ